MTFKENAVKRTVTGTFSKINGEPVAGKVSFTLARIVKGREEDVVYTDHEVTVTLDEDGEFFVDLPVTIQGLTSAEKSQLNQIQSDREQNLEDLAALQEEINVYLDKMSNGTPVTEPETEAYHENVEEKKTLQEEAINLTKQYDLLLDKQKELLDNAVKVKGVLITTNPVLRTKFDFSIPEGTSPVDITDLPKA